MPAERRPSDPLRTAARRDGGGSARPGGVPGPIPLEPDEEIVAEYHPDCYWLYVATSLGTVFRLGEPIESPARDDRREATDVAHDDRPAEPTSRPWQVHEGGPGGGDDALLPEGER